MNIEPSGLLRIFRTGLIVLAAVTLLLGAHAATGANQVATQTAAQPSNGVDPDTLPKSSADATTIVRWLSPGLYQLDVENTSGVGYIDSFNWVPPTNMTVISVTSAEGGKCAVANGEIQCTGKIAPPTCTCRGGGNLTVNFTAKGLDPTFANGYWTYYGIVGSYLQIETVTPVPYHIPSAEPTSSADVPLCKKGQTSTAKNPCL